MLSTKFMKNMSNKITAVLIDLSGTLHIDDQPTFNAVKSLEKLRNVTNVHIRFVTNTTKESGETLLNRLTRIGFRIDANEIYSSLSAAANYVQKNRLKPFYLLSADARKDFPDDNISDENYYNAVVVGLAPDEFYYENFNKAFRVLMKGHPLIAIHEGKYYKRQNDLALGPGCFTRGLEYSASTTAIIVGKPNQYFFENAIPSGCQPSDCVMIGDDINDDIKGAMAIGMKGILVKTGKYLPNVNISPEPTVTVDNFSAGVDWIIESLRVCRY